MDTLKYILDKFNLTYPSEAVRLPIEIPNFGRVQMAGLFNELGFRVGVEIGVRGGDYSLVLCETIPGLRLYGVDPYTPHAEYKDIQRKDSFDKYEQEAKRKLAPYGENYQFMRLYSMDAVKHFKDNSLDFVYIDGDHSFQSVTNDIYEWSKKVKVGGIISGDDYFKHKGPSNISVYQAVNGITDAEGIKPWFVLGSKAIVPGEIRDHGRSWMWVKK